MGGALWSAATASVRWHRSRDHLAHAAGDSISMSMCSCSASLNPPRRNNKHPNAYHLRPRLQLCLDALPVPHMLVSHHQPRGSSQGTAQRREEVRLPSMDGAYDELVSSHSHSSGGGTACLCSARPGRHALEQEMLYRVDLQLQGGAAAPASARTAGGDHRKRRMMKNRESAARSRARKQAYMHELEKEVRLLRAEIDALREQCEELKAAAAAEAPAPVKKRLQRASSASF